MDSSLQPCEIKAISNILLMRKQTGDVICLRQRQDSHAGFLTPSPADLRVLVGWPRVCQMPCRSLLEPD